MNFKDLQEANKFISTIELKGKSYALVNERVKAFRFLFPNGTIKTTLLEDNGERCTMLAEVFDNEKLIATGHAFEEKSSSFVNKTSYIENCETSAIGRALAMVGIGIDVSIASYEEVNNAINNQGKEETALPNRADMIKAIIAKYPRGSEDFSKLLAFWKVPQIEKATNAQIMAVYNKYCEA